MPQIAQWDVTAAAAFAVVAICCLALGLVAAAGKKGAAKSTVRRDPKSTVGLLLQMAAYAICYCFPRPYFTQFVPMSKWNERIFSAVAILLALASIGFCYSAARALGKQWSLMARLVEGHELIVQGPYAVVRNPIYLAMFGTVVAAGLTATRWPQLLVAILVFLAGTWIRIHTEESVLRHAFGARFDEYARAVPAFLPRLL